MFTILSCTKCSFYKVPGIYEEKTLGLSHSSILTHFFQALSSFTLVIGLETTFLNLVLHEALDFDVALFLGV